MLVMHFRIQIFPLMKEFLSVHHPIILTGLKDLPPTPKNIGDALSGPQRQFRKEALFVQYDLGRGE